LIVYIYGSYVLCVYLSTAPATVSMEEAHTHDGGLQSCNRDTATEMVGT